MPHDFSSVLASRAINLPPLPLQTLQLNVTKLCNQACTHCHVDSSPRRREAMSDEVIDRCLEVVRLQAGITTIDLTGGAPELHPRFCDLVKDLRRLGRKVIVRHNLTVTRDKHPLSKASMAYLPEFFATQGVHLIASLPCYDQANTDGQRGSGVFKKSIDSLRLLNQVGYGRDDTGLRLDLIYNPVGTNLPASQQGLEQQFKHRLFEDFGIVFSHLYTMTNMPIHRFKAQLLKDHSYELYMQKLSDAFNPAAAAGLMCRSLISVAYDGSIYDCDFNQMLKLPVLASGVRTIFDFDAERLQARQLHFANHCFGCTAAAGSSCTGTTAPSPEVVAHHQSPL